MSPPLGAPSNKYSYEYHRINIKESRYSCNWKTNPRFGKALLRFVRTNSTASLTDHPRAAIKYADTTLALRLTPCTQWTSMRPRGSASASAINAVVRVRCPASSSNGSSRMGICSVRRGGRVEGRWITPGIMDKTWEMPSEL